MPNQNNPIEKDVCLISEHCSLIDNTSDNSTYSPTSNPFCSTHATNRLVHLLNISSTV